MQFLLMTPHGFYFRMKVPKRHRDHFQRREFKKALKTSDRTEAQKKALCLAAQVEDYIQKLDVLRGFRMSTKLPLFTTIHADSAKVTKDSIEVFGFKTDPRYPEAEVLATKEFYAGLEAAQKSLINNNPEPVTVQAVPVPENTKPEIKTKLLAQLIEDYVKEKTTSGAWKNELANGRKQQLLRFLEYFGNVDVATLERDDAYNFLDTIKKLPPNIKKNKDYANMTLTEIADTNQGPTISPKSVNMTMNDVSGFFKWCVRFKHAKSNCFEGLSVKEPEQDITQRLPYTPESLIDLFNHKYFQEHKCKASEFFLPVLGLYTGARLNELCQLHTADIVQYGGIWCLDINAKDKQKSLKTKDSKRIIPLHREVLRMNFLEYVKKLEPGRVFPNLKFKNGSFSGDYSKRFGTIRKNTGTTDYDFHSFRHLVVDELKNLMVEEFLVAGLVGHKHKQITFSRYGAPTRAKMLKPVIEKLEYQVNIVPWKC